MHESEAELNPEGKEVNETSVNQQTIEINVEEISTNHVEAEIENAESAAEEIAVEAAHEPVAEMEIVASEVQEPVISETEEVSIVESPEELVSEVIAETVASSSDDGLADEVHHQETVAENVSVEAPEPIVSEAEEVSIAESPEELVSEVIVETVASSSDDDLANEVHHQETVAEIVSVEAPEPIISETEEVSKEEASEELVVEAAIVSAVAASSDDDSDEEDHHEEIDEELNAQVAWDELSRGELLERLKIALADPNSTENRTFVGKIREAYRNLRSEEIRSKREKYLENEGVPEDFEVPKDSVDEEFDDLFKNFREIRTQIREQRERDFSQNLKKREVILDELRTLLEETTDIPKSFDKLHELQKQWREAGNVAPNLADELWKNYRHYINSFNDLFHINNELRELDHRKNLEAKTELCEKAESLFIEDSIKSSLDSYKVLQEQWKEVGHVAKDLSETIWDRFRAAGDKLFDRRREYIQEQEQYHAGNLEKKQAVVAKAEELKAKLPFNAHNQWQEASEAVAAMMEEWKQAGFASRKDNEAIWDVFKALREDFYTQKEGFYKGLREAQNQNYKVKVDLCMEAEALRDNSDWKKTGDRLRELQEQWKKSGPVAKKFSDKLWKRFRTACDLFFANRNKHFEGMNEEHDENLKKKRELIERIKAYEHAEDGNETFEALKGFQNEWMEIGHVPMKEKDKVQKAYRQVIDEQFAKFKQMSADTRRDVFRAQVRSVGTDKGGKDKLQHQRNVVQDKIRRLQGEIQTLENNIGFFGTSKSKAADEMRRDIEKKISKTKEEIGQLYDQMNILRES